MKVALWILAALACFTLALLAGVWLRTQLAEPVAIWTPAPVGSPAATNVAILPVMETPTELSPAPTLAPLPTLVPLPAATPDPKRITITEADVTGSLASGVGAQQGLTASDLTVRFTGGKLRLTADMLAYGPISVRNLLLVGTLVAQDGRLQLQTETISPSNLVTALIPTLADQALAQYTGQWYIEEAQTLDGRLEVKIR